MKSQRRVLFNDFLYIGDGLNIIFIHYLIIINNNINDIF